MATQKEFHEFHILTAESTFIVRTFFFLFFGFSIQLSAFDSFTPLFYGLLVFLVMFIVRYLYFSISSFSLKPSPLVYMSPRGLISILLFLQLKEVSFINTNQNYIDERLLLIVILSSMFVMLLGTIKKQSAPFEEENEEENALTVEMEVNSENSTDQETTNL